MERIKLQAEKRDTKTKGEIRQLRLKGRVPAVLYGKKREPLTVIVNEAELLKATSTKAGLNVLIDLAVEGEKPTTVLVRDYQAHPVHRTFTHVDFQAIDITEKIVVEVPIILNGVAIGVKEGGILEQLMRKIELKCLPTQIPEKIEIDVDNLKIGDSIHSVELKLPAGAEFPRVMNYAIATVVPPAKEEVPAAAAAPVEGAVPAEGAAAPAAEGAPAAPGAAPAKGAAPGAAPAKGAAPGAAPAKGAAPAAAPAKGAAPAAAPAKGGEKGKK